MEHKGDIFIVKIPTALSSIKKAAVELESQIGSGLSDLDKLGTNVTLNFEGIGDIRPSLLAELKEGGYKMVFVLNRDVPINGIDDLLKYVDGNRADVLSAIKGGNVPTTKLKGANAQHYFGKSDVEVAIKEIEVYTVDGNGNLVGNEIKVLSDAGSKWLHNLEPLLGAGSITKIQKWLNEGLDATKVRQAFTNAFNKNKFFNNLDNAKSIQHRKVLTDDYNVSGITQGNYLTNSVDNINNDIIRNVVNKEIKMYKSQASTFVKNASLQIRNSIEIVEDLGNGIQLIKVKSGTKMYRIFDGYKPWDDITRSGNTLPNGSYWTFDKPSQISDVIEGTAVMPEWNGMSKIIEIEVPSDGLYGWYGKAAKQPASSTTNNFYLKGGEEQVIISFGQNNQSISSVAKNITSAPWID